MVDTIASEIGEWKKLGMVVCTLIPALGGLKKETVSVESTWAT